APLSFTWAGAGAASARAAATPSRAVFFMPSTSSVLERELGLEQGLRAGGFLRRRSLVAQVVPVAEQAPIGRELVRHAADEASLLVGGVSRLRVEDVHARDDGGLGPCELVDAEGAVEVAVGRRPETVLGRRSLPREGELLGAVGHHGEIAVAVGVRRGPAVGGVTGDAESADATGVVRVEHPHRDACHRILTLAPGARDLSGLVG